MEKEVPICASCGSHDIRKEASVAYDKETLEWIVTTIYDGGFCESCGYEGEVEWEAHEADETPSSENADAS